MGKNELLLNIDETRNLIKKLQNIHRSLTSLYKKPIKLGCLGHLVFFIVYWIAVSFSLAYILGVVFYPIKLVFPQNMVDSFGTAIAILILVIVAFSYPYLFNLINKKRLKVNAEIAKSADTIRLELEKQTIIDYIKTHSVIPDDYCYLHALNTFEKYLINNRADSLKECINLFEQEKRHDEQLQEIRVIQQIQEATYQKANEAATIGWINLFTRR